MGCLFHPAFPCLERLTPGKPTPLKGANMWLHLSCHQSIQFTISGYNFATSSCLLFKILYFATVVTLHNSFVNVMNISHISGPMCLAIHEASFLKCHWHPATHCFCKLITVNYSNCFVISPTFITHEKSWIEHFSFCFWNFHNKLIEKFKELGYVLGILTSNLHGSQT